MTGSVISFSPGAGRLSGCHPDSSVSPSGFGGDMHGFLHCCPRRLNGNCAVCHRGELTGLLGRSSDQLVSTRRSVDLGCRSVVLNYQVSVVGALGAQTTSPIPATAKASLSVVVEDTSETDPAGGSASTSPSKAKNSVKCGE
jgi:hypothetical protein